MSLRLSRFPLLIAALGLLVSVVGCGGGGRANPPPIDETLFIPNYVADLTGLYHWNHLPMTVVFYLPSNWAQLYPSDQDLHVDAANEWNQAGKQALVAVVPPGNPADTTVTFVDQSELGGTVRGRTECRVDSLNVLHSATIKVALDMPHGGYAPASETQATIAHELGHALGIYGHSPYADDLMYATLVYGHPKTTSTRDLNTVMTAYPAYFVSRTLVPLRSPAPSEPGEVFTVVIE